MMANPAFAQAPPCSPDALTAVELTWLEKRVEHWIRFGRDIGETIIDRRRRVLSFAPNTIFAFVRWAANDFGTVVSRIDIVRVGRAGRSLSDAALRASRRRDPAAHQRLAQGRARVRGDRRRRSPRHRSGRRGARTLAACPQPPRRRIRAASL